jgi:hypothetical protein
VGTRVILREPAFAPDEAGQSRSDFDLESREIDGAFRDHSNRSKARARFVCVCVASFSKQASERKE